jgi:hypothetical protein
LILAQIYFGRYYVIKYFKITPSGGKSTKVFF